MILQYSIIIFITQLVFIGSRTLNVKAISKGNMAMALISGGVVHISWLVSIALGSVSMYEIINNYRWDYWPIVLCSLSGGLIGTYIGLKEKKR